MYMSAKCTCTCMYIIQCTIWVAAYHISNDSVNLCNCLVSTWIISASDPVLDTEVLTAVVVELTGVNADPLVER